MKLFEETASRFTTPGVCTLLETPQRLESAVIGDARRDSLVALEQMFEHGIGLLLELKTHSSESCVDVAMQCAGVHHEQAGECADDEDDERCDQPRHTAPSISSDSLIRTVADERAMGCPEDLDPDWLRASIERVQPSALV